jgi:transposase
VGIDVSKASLDVATSAPDGAASAAGDRRARLGRAAPQAGRFPNTAAGIADLVRQVQTWQPALVVLEATGAYHVALVQALAGAHMPVALVNPAQVKAFRQVTLGRNKTDRLDAGLLARFAASHGATLRRYVAPPAVQQELRDLLGYREQLVKQRTALRNTREAHTHAGVCATVATWASADLAQVEARLREVDATVRRVVATLPQAQVLHQAVKGAGPLVVAAVLAYLPVAVWGHAKAAAACAGLHPANADSGQTTHAHLSRAGTARLRRYLYLAALAAKRCDADFRAFVDRLIARGKARKAALVALMHKLLRRLMGLLRSAALPLPTTTA